MDERTIGNLYNQVIGETDKSRRNFTNIVITIFTAVSSGLVLLSISLIFIDQYERYLFTAMVGISLLVLLCAILDNFLYYLIKNNIAEEFCKYVREHENIPHMPLCGKKWQSKLVVYLSPVILFLILTNALVSFIFVLMRVY